MVFMIFMEMLLKLLINYIYLYIEVLVVEEVLFIRYLMCDFKMGLRKKIIKYF